MRPPARPLKPAFRVFSATVNPPPTLSTSRSSRRRSVMVTSTRPLMAARHSAVCLFAASQRSVRVLQSEGGRRGRLPVFVPCVDFAFSASQQDAHHFLVAGFTCRHQRRKTILASAIGVCPTI